MPTNKNDFSDIGSSKSDYVFLDKDNLDFILKKGLEFKKRCVELINERGVSASGTLIDSIGDPVITKSMGGVTMTIEMADYYDYTNKGVKGWKDSSRAPNSPYQYKTKGMDDKGKKSIEEYIRSGRKKITTFSQAYKEMETKLKRRNKGNELFEFAVKNTIFGVKAKGLRAKNWFDDAVKDVFGDFEEVMAEQIGSQISVTIKL